MADENKNEFKDQLEGANEAAEAEKANSEAEVSPADYNDSEAGNTPNVGEPGGENLETPEQQAEVEGEGVNNPQPDTAEAPADEPEDSGTGADPEDSKITTPEQAEQAIAAGEDESEVTEEERGEFQRLKDKRKNMPLDSEDIDRWETLNRKING